MSDDRRLSWDEPAPADLVDTLAAPETRTPDVAGEIRAIAARQHVSYAEIARRCGRTPMWLSRRLAPSYGPVPMSVDDLTLIAGALQVTASEILDAAAANGEQR